MEKQKELVASPFKLSREVSSATTTVAEMRKVEKDEVKAKEVNAVSPLKAVMEKNEASSVKLIPAF